MLVKVLHHGRCFDGAASAALFAGFYRQTQDSSAEFSFIPKHHKIGDPFEDSDFEASEVAIVDFRYSQRPGLTWYFDHHRSAFQLPGDREHFEADKSGQKFHDANEPCCASYMAKIAEKKYGYSSGHLKDLLDWATRIDSASFDSPNTPVAMSEPALQLAAFIQSANERSEITQFIEDLLTTPLDKLAQAEYVQKVVQPRVLKHREDVKLLGQIANEQSGVLEYNLLPYGPRILSHFIPYYHYPSVKYVVGVYSHQDGDLRLTVGFNPWLPENTRTVDLAALCERFGGGGHPQVAGCSFSLGEEERLLKTQQDMLEILRNAA